MLYRICSVVRVVRRSGRAPHRGYPTALRICGFKELEVWYFLKYILDSRRCGPSDRARRVFFNNCLPLQAKTHFKYFEQTRARESQGNRGSEATREHAQHLRLLSGTRRPAAAWPLGGAEPQPPSDSRVRQGRVHELVSSRGLQQLVARRQVTCGVTAALLHSVAHKVMHNVVHNVAHNVVYNVRHAVRHAVVHHAAVH